MNYYKITIYNSNNELVSTYFKSAETCEDAIMMVLKVIQLLSGDSIKIEEM